ncbi:MAG: hypothetical protein ABIT70_11165 [Sulfuriferula sp.]
MNKQIGQVKKAAGHNGYMYHDGHQSADMINTLQRIMKMIFKTTRIAATATALAGMNSA